MKDITFALGLILSGKMAKREVSKKDTVLIIYKDMLHQLDQSTGVREPYILSDADIHATDWVQVFPDEKV